VQQKIEKIKQWINGDLTYKEAVSIFLELSTNKHLSRILFASENKYNREKLTSELKKILSSYEQKQNALQSRPSVIDSVSKNISTSSQENINQNVLDSVRTSNYPRSNDHTSIFNSIVEKRKEAYRKRGHYHGQLHNAKSDQERFALAKEIYLIQKDLIEINESYHQALNGNIPISHTKQINADVEKVLKIQNLKIYVNRYNNLISKTKDQKKIENYKKTLKKHSDEIKKLLNE